MNKLSFIFLMLSLERLAFNALTPKYLREGILLGNPLILQEYNIEYIGDYFPRITSVKYKGLPMSYVITSKEDYLPIFKGPQNEKIINAFTEDINDKYLKGCVFQIKDCRYQLSLLDWSNSIVPNAIYHHKDNCFVFDIKNDENVEPKLKIKQYYIYVPLSTTFQTLMDSFSCYYWKRIFPYYVKNFNGEYYNEINISMKIAYLRNDLFEIIRNKKHAHNINNRKVLITPSEGDVKFKITEIHKFDIIFLVSVGLFILLGLVMLGSGIAMISTNLGLLLAICGAIISALNISLCLAFLA